uniref:Uncharacterized protein n=1 Tax=Arundo donax TaxID=35708 RepID=A0A0A9H6L4_ARUDO
MEPFHPTSSHQPNTPLMSGIQVHLIIWGFSYICICLRGNSYSNVCQLFCMYKLSGQRIHSCITSKFAKCHIKYCAF